MAYFPPQNLNLCATPVLGLQYPPGQDISEIALPSSGLSDLPLL